MPNNCLILPDIHGRTFWIEPCKNKDNYDKIIFLGDYLDPYPFEDISEEKAIENFKKIIRFKEKNTDKVVLLLGNHDCPYAFPAYYEFSDWHCRHSYDYHDEISRLFMENMDLFQLSYVYENILFTHAGVDSRWLEEAVGCREKDIDKISDALNELATSSEGLRKLYCIASSRGGCDRYGSCLWSDVDDIENDIESRYTTLVTKPIHRIRQIFGHTLQAKYDRDRKIVYGNAVSFENCKMLDTAHAYELNTAAFEITKL